MDQNQRNKKGYILIASVISVLLLGAIGVLAYNHFINNNPMLQYVKAEKNTMEEAWDYLDKYYGDSKSVEEKLLNEAHKSTATFSASSKLPPQLTMEEPMIGFVQGVIAGLKLVTETRVNPDSKESFVNVDLNMTGTSLISGEFYQNKEHTAIQIPALYDKYFTFENSKLGDYLRKQGAIEVPIEEIPNLIETQQNALTPEKLKVIAQDYLKTIADSISEDKLTVTKNVEYEGRKYTKLSLPFTEAEAHQLIKELLTKMKTDDRLFNSFGSADIQKEQLDWLINNVELLKLPKGMTYEAYMNNDYVSYRVLSFDVTDEREEDTVQIELKMDTLINANDQYVFNFEIQAKPKNEEGKFVVQYREDGKPEDNQYKVKRNIGFLFTDQYDNIDFGIDANTIYKNNTSETNFNLHFNIPEVQAIPQVSGFLNTSVNDEGKKASKTFEVGIDVDMNDPMMGSMAFNFTLNGENDITFTDELEFPALESSNTVSVFKLSDQEFEQIMAEIEQNANAYFQSMFGSFGGF